MLLTSAPVCHGAELKTEYSLHEIMATLTVDDSLFDAATRVSVTSERLKQQADLRSAQLLTGYLEYLSTACLHYRRMGRDSGWSDLRPVVSALLLRVRSAIAMAGGKNALISENPGLVQALEECRSACSEPISW